MRSSKKLIHSRQQRTLRLRSARGQGLAEYALILALVALAVIAIGLLLGLATQRNYGLVAGALGAHKEETGAQEIRIEQARCIAVPDVNQTGMFVTGFTNVPLDQLQVYTTKSAGKAFDADSDGIIDERPLLLNEDVPGTFKWNPMIKSAEANTGLCPVSIMITTADGKLSAISPVKIETQ
ncbi:MAG: hypothetical protein U0528_07315 [Anaerolineae bacterium]|nr:hypothetical protein [Anaerolineae bacterium]